ncbi:hypothetical protein GCM10023185_34950 [Hymenobacter saemangeumensis]|uniref:TIGR02646 family protein n=1 Tax=Hymenobacter saemangeumensis TaxID=1084522 RepID=A0ABP8IPU6_9BACT
MIRLQRNRKAVPAEYHGSIRLARERELIEMARLVQPDSKGKMNYIFNSKYWKKAKPQLIKESFGKCAYCEAPTNAVAHGDVEHFRPKSVYWWLAYCYDNYLYSCQICNQKHKGNKFPVGASPWTGPDLLQVKEGELGVDPLAGQALLDEFQAAFASEQAELPNPYDTDPEPFFIWKADDVLGEVDILPNPNHPSAGPVFKAIKDCYGLQRKELAALRYQVYKIFEVSKLATYAQLPQPLAAGFALQVQRMKDASAPFAGMIRYFDTIIKPS